MKVETHNHPTAISPFPGASTGAGGEIRDEGATGRGAKPKAGLTGFTVVQPAHPRLRAARGSSPTASRSASSSALEIMIEGPLGGAAFNNEFGRPNLCGYFRSFEQQVPTPEGVEVRGYHKPIMIAGGLGNIRAEHVQKGDAASRAPSSSCWAARRCCIGLGGGAASSMAQRRQRGGPGFRLACSAATRRWSGAARKSSTAAGRWATHNPILSIHDVGAGGLSNAFPELVHDDGRGGRFDLRKVPNDEPGMAPMEIWCNEAQERYVLAIAPEDLARFEALCERERCPVRRASARRPRSRQLTLTRPRSSATARSTCRWTCCSASRRSMHRDVKSRPLAHCRRSTWTRSS